MSKKKGYSKNFELDWDFYVANSNKFTFAAEAITGITEDLNGVDAKRAFFIFDSTGKRVPTSEPQILHDVIRCKKAINFQLKAWGEGYEDCLISAQEYMTEFNPPIPTWVETSLRQQIKKQYARRQVMKEERRIQEAKKEAHAKACAEAQKNKTWKWIKKKLRF